MRNVLFTIGLIVSIPLLVLCLPVILIYNTITEWLQRRQLGLTPCPDCCIPFGIAEVRRARTACEKSTREKMRQIMARGVRPRIVAIWRLSCSACDVQFTYAPSTGHLRPVDSRSDTK